VGFVTLKRGAPHQLAFAPAALGEKGDSMRPRASLPFHQKGHSVMSRWFEVDNYPSLERRHDDFVASARRPMT